MKVKRQSFIIFLIITERQKLLAQRSSKQEIFIQNYFSKHIIEQFHKRKEHKMHIWNKLQSSTTPTSWIYILRCTRTRITVEGVQISKKVSTKVYAGSKCRDQSLFFLTLCYKKFILHEIETHKRSWSVHTKDCCRSNIPLSRAWCSSSTLFKKLKKPSSNNVLLVKPWASSIDR